MIEILLVGIGGAVGGVLRHLVARAVDLRLRRDWPWGTLAVNLSGAALIGLLAALMLPGPAGAGAPLAWMLFVVGVLGSYTTVSAFSLQVLTLWETGRGRAALAYVAASVALCLAAAATAFLAAASVMGA